MGIGWVPTHYDDGVHHPAESAGQEDDDISAGDEDVVGGRGGRDVEPCNFSI